MVEGLIALIVLGGVLGIIWWAIREIPMPPPIAIGVRVVFALIVALIALYILLPYAHLPPPGRY